jgi:hypothetical protein
MRFDGSLELLLLVGVIERFLRALNAWDALAAHGEAIGDAPTSPRRVGST